MLNSDHNAPLDVHIAPGLDTAPLAALWAQLDPSIRLTLGPEPPVPADYAVLVCGRPGAELLDASPNLRLVVVPYAGLPEATRQLLLVRRDLALHNLHHNAAPTAEIAVALLLAAAKRIVPGDRALRVGDWTPRYDDDGAVLLEGKTALVLGLGAVGTRVARACRGLGMRVVGVRRSLVRPPGPPADLVQPPGPPADLVQPVGAPADLVQAVGAPADLVDAAAEADEIHPIAALSALLPMADALIVCVPLTPDTTGLLGARELALLPSRAVIVNIARGPVIDEAALYAALVERRIHSAGLDVWWRYPGEADRQSTPPATCPFHELENVVMSPHRAGHVAETEALRMTHLARLLNAVARREAVPNRVDLGNGY